jgi:hypothetical protein
MVVMKLGAVAALALAVAPAACAQASDDAPVVPEEKLSTRPGVGGSGAGPSSEPGTTPPPTGGGNLSPGGGAGEPGGPPAGVAVPVTDAGAAPGAAARDGASVAADASAPALTLGGPAPPCRFRFCESFETAAVGAAPNPAVWRKSGSMTVVAGGAARGNNALEVKTPATPSETFITATQPLPAGTRSFWGRLFFNITVRPADFFHFSLVEVKNNDARGPGLRYGGISTGTCAPKTFCYDTFMFQLKPQAYGADEGAVLTDDLKQVISDKAWHCMEWFFDADKREARLFYDGQERSKVHYSNGKPQYGFPDLLRLSIGWGHYQTGKAGVGWTVLLDEIAVHDQRVGCDP